MSNRKLIRPEIVDKRGAEPRAVTRRKQSPPEQTNAEEFYYLKQMAARTPMVVVLTNGEELRGWIEWYDKGALKLNRHAGPNLLIPKHNIRYLFKEEELKRGRRRDGAEEGASSVPGKRGRIPESRELPETGAEGGADAEPS
jgi:sRNA-binding regulator protein Hfq